MLTIERPRPEDAEGINEVIKLSWYDTYVVPEIGVTKEDIDLMYAQSEQQQIEVFRKRAENPKDGDWSFVAKEDGKVVGFARFVAIDDHIRVRTFYVHPDHVGRGIGTSLWKEALNYLPKDKSVIAWPTEHTKSVNFYKKLGFVPTGETEYGEPMASGARMHVLKMVYARNDE